MRASTLLAAAASALTASAAPIASYTWSITNWSGGWYGIGWANYQVTAPAATSNGVTIPALSLTSRCEPWGAEGTVRDCSDLIANNNDGRTYTGKIGSFDDGAVSYGNYTFKSGDKTYSVTGTIKGVENGASAFTVSGLQLTQL
ncbi:hypothetical protein CORC01_06792 [Colletotrichum orchidophilum]|uniref:Uncharacterized protein n=1 Tax=Colletotrichum orchidophilum TaxID=1209926 RepID=A0A1G4B932_9PEZI|nr:uncharacterized protein CORC01_06792 [Colletotrichum orchidophilum]OHE97929.1 hypothetical protein CORC01_06792 [Colletotrichum orchidophilum]